MTEPINLNRFRKAKARDAKRARAEENAVKFGRTKAERAADQAEPRRLSRDLDGKKREDRGPDQE
jgi:hypothetical protein